MTDHLARQRAFAAHLRDPAHAPAPEGVEDRRVAIYRDLFYNNIASLLASNFPVIRTLLDDAAWHALVRDFYANHRSHTPLFPEIGRELVRFLEGRENDPPWLAELAHYEWVELAVSIDEASFDDVAHDPDGDVIAGRPVLSPLAWPLAYRWPVHAIRAEFRPSEPPAQPTCLVVARNRADDVAFLEATPVILRLIEHVQGNSARTGLGHVQALAHELGSPDDPTIVAAGVDVLKKLAARDILLVAR